MDQVGETSPTFLLGHPTIFGRGRQEGMQEQALGRAGHDRLGGLDGQPGRAVGQRAVYSVH